jgi:hypothetical protein
MTQQGKFEYKLTIGALSSEVAGQLMLKKWKISEGRSIDNYPRADFTLRLNASSMAVANEDVVRYWRREYGEATWGPTFYLGTVTRTDVNRKDAEVTIESEGYLGVVKKRSLSSISWGNVHIVDKVYPARIIATGNYLNRLYAELDAGSPAQVPLESVKVCILDEMVTGGRTTNTISVWNFGAGNNQKVAQQFIGRNSTIRRFWVRGYVNNTNQDLRVSIQADSGGVPSGVEIAAYEIPNNLFGIGAGAEAWVEVDLLFNVTDPTHLTMAAIAPYWLVFSITNIDNTVFDLRLAEFDPTPKHRTMQSNNSGAGWAYFRTQQSLFYAIDFEDDWEELVFGLGHDYDVQGDINAPLLIFYKTDYQLGDPGGLFYFQGKVFPVLFDGQNLIRVSYWRGYMTYSTVLQYWAQTMASNLYNILDISITEPATKQFCIQAQNADGFTVFKLLRQYGAFYVRIYENAAGQVVLEIRDERVPQLGVWNVIYSTIPESDAHTFVMGLDAPASPDRVRIVDISSFKELVSSNDISVIKDAHGNIVSVIGTGSITGAGVSTLGGFGGKLSDGQAFNQVLEALRHTIKEGGRVMLSGTNQTMAIGAFRHSNELVMITDSIQGWNQKLFAVQGMKWTGGNKATTRVELTFSDVVFTVFTGDENPGGPSLPPGNLTGKGNIFSQLRGGLGSGFAAGPDGRARTGFSLQGATDAPTRATSMAGMSMRASENIFHADATVVHDDTKFWWIRMGTGTPPGGGSHALGAQILEVIAKYQVIGAWTYLTAVIHAADVLPWRGVWPKVISEVGLAYSDDEVKTGLTAVKAYSIGVPSGTKDIFGPQPELGPDKTIFVTLKVIPSP